MTKPARMAFLVGLAILQSIATGFAQSCPPTPQARLLQTQRDPFGTYCMRVGQAEIAREKCRVARSAIDLDECQYLASSLVSALRDCVALGGPYGAKCADMVNPARALLGDVAQNPVLQQHRENQRQQDGDYSGCRGNIGIQCMGRCGNDTACIAACNSNNAWRCN